MGKGSSGIDTEESDDKTTMNSPVNEEEEVIGINESGTLNGMASDPVPSPTAETVTYRRGRTCLSTGER